MLQKLNRFIAQRYASNLSPMPTGSTTSPVPIHRVGFLVKNLRASIRFYNRLGLRAISTEREGMSDLGILRGALFDLGRSRVVRFISPPHEQMQPNGNPSRMVACLDPDGYTVMIGQAGPRIVEITS